MVICGNPALKSKFADELFRPGATKLNNFCGRLISVVGEIEQLDISDCGHGIIVCLYSDYTTAQVGVHFRLDILAIQESFQGVSARMGDIESLLLEENGLSFAFKAVFVQQEHQDAQDGEENTEYRFDKIKADAGGQNYGGYYEILCGMDLFEFDFHDIIN